MENESEDYLDYSRVHDIGLTNNLGETLVTESGDLLKEKWSGQKIDVSGTPEEVSEKTE